MKISKIVVTGGPCAGKTTGLSWIQNALTERGYKVLFVPETATELIGGGVAPWSCSSVNEYQRLQLKLQTAKEQVYEEAAKGMNSDKILIVCDRGFLDNKAYMTDESFAQLISSLGLNETELRDGYDAVFHMETAAKGAESYYTLSNNTARTETPGQARALDDRLISAWTGHPHLRIIDNSTDFEGKMRRLIAEILSFLGEPEPYQIERKYLIKYPDIAYLESLPNSRRVEIEQVYLSSDDDEEVRIRKRGSDGHYIYYESRKREISGVKRIEMERRLSLREYMNLLTLADRSLKPVTKDRYYLAEGGLYYKIDIYPEHTDTAILELELLNEDQPVKIPDYIDVLGEVTDDKNFRNHSIARMR